MKVGNESASVTVLITNPLGLHARPAMSFVDLANGFGCDIRVHKGQQVVDGKSIMGLMMLAATQGTTMTITVEGEDAESAMHDIVSLFENRFDEHE